MSVLLEWAKDMVIYLILLTLLMHVMPGKKYEKYFRLFAGMVFLIIMVQPTFSILSMEGTLEAGLESFLEQNRLEDLFGETPDFLEAEKEEQKRLWNQELTTFVKEAAGGLHLTAENIEIGWEEGEEVLPGSIEIYVSDQENEGKAWDTITIKDIIVGTAKEEEETQNSAINQLRQVVANYIGIEQEEVTIHKK